MSHPLVVTLDRKSAPRTIFYGDQWHLIAFCRQRHDVRDFRVDRISNMITTRSDSFTVYAVVEGWLNAGTPLAERVSQKRIAFIADRSQVKGLVSPQGQTVLTTPVATD